MSRLVKPLSDSDDDISSELLETNMTSHCQQPAHFYLDTLNASSCCEDVKKEETFHSNAVTKFAIPTCAIPPRNKTPSEGLVGAYTDINPQLNPVTPTKLNDTGIDPLTPTANLKILAGVASPEIRNREKLKEKYQIGIKEEQQCISEIQGKKPKCILPRHKSSDSDDFDLATDNETSSNTIVSRKEKSLGLLCQKFLQRYPEYPCQQVPVEISLDEVAKDLGVERRRIYDIVNVLESVEIVSRLAKNRYLWHGKTNLRHTLAKLKALAHHEGFDKQIERVKEFEISKDLKEESKTDSPRKKKPLKFNDDSNLQSDSCIADNLRKEKSLGIMSQKFLMLFLVSAPRTVNLDISAKILVGDPNIDRTENAKFKTKIRRLYDIANILTSLDLIKKVHVTEVRGRKPAFKYVGPDIDEVNDIAACTHDGAHRPSSKHSMLDCVQNPQVYSMMNNQPSNFKIPSRHNILSQLGESTQPHNEKFQTLGKKNVSNTSMKKVFSRHASLEQICEVAEQERNRLYFESKSQPTSPNFKKQATLLPKRESQKVQGTFSSDINAPTANLKTMQEENTVKQYQVLLKHAGCNGTKDSPVAGSSSTVVQKIPINPVTLTSVQSPAQNCQMSKSEQIILRPQVVGIPGRQPTVVRLSKMQLEAMVKQLNNTFEQGTEVQNCNSKLVDAATQSSPELANGISSVLNQQNHNAPTCQKDFGRGPQHALKSPCVQLASQETVVHNVNVNGTKVQILTMQSLPIGVHNTNTQKIPNVMDNQRISHTKDIFKKRHASFEGIEKPAKVQRMDGNAQKENGMITNQDIEVANINVTARAIAKAKPSPLRALHLEPGFRTSPNSEDTKTFKSPNPSPDVVSKVTVSDLELASPLPAEDISSRPGSSASLHTPVGHVYGEHTPTQSLQNVFQFPTSQSISTTQSQTMPTFRLSATSSPVMLLPSRPSSLGGDAEFLHTMKYPTSVSSLSDKSNLIRCKSASPSTMKFTSSRISPLQLNNNKIMGTQSHQITTSQVSAVSTPITLMTSLASTDNLTSTSSAILNIIPQLNQSPSYSNLNIVGPGITHLPLAMLSQQHCKIQGTTVHGLTVPRDASVQAELNATQSLSQTIHISPSQTQVDPTKTPTNQIVNLSFLQQGQNNINITPSYSHSLATPTSFFRTPGGLVPITSLTPHSGTQGSSAFQFVGKPPVIESSAARKLNISDLEQKM